MDTTIRNVEKSDIEDIRELNMASWLEAYEDIVPEDKIRDGVKYPESRLKDKMNDDKLIFLVAEVNGRVIGTINFCFGKENTHDFVSTEQGEAQLRSVYLHPDYWDQGIGTKLFKKGVEMLPKNIDFLKVESLKENEIGRSFYSSLGFSKTDERKVELFGDNYPSVIQENQLSR